MSTKMLIKPTRMFPIVTAMETFGNFIARRREWLGLSQRALAKKVGVSHATISKIESGLAVDIKYNTFIGLAEALRVHPMQLISAHKGKIDDVDLPEQRLDLDDDFAQSLIELLKSRGYLG